MTIKHLIKRIREEGITRATTRNGARNTIQNWINRGNLQLRKSPASNYYLVNEKEIEDIVREFSPGGSGVFHADI